MNILPTKNISDDYATETSCLTSTRFDDIGREELVNLLEDLKRQAQSLTPSPRKVVLDHAIQIFQSFLNNLLEIDWHKHLYEQAQLQNKGLNDQLSLMLKLLDFANSSALDANQNASKPNEHTTLHTARQSIDQWVNMTASDSAHPPMTPQRSCQNSIAEAPQTSTDLNPNNADTAKLDVYFLGTFRVYRDGELIDCLSKSRAKQLLKYLILNRTKAIPKEVLMDRFWPDHDQNSARNNLNVAVYCLRQALKNEHSNLVHVLFQDGCYCVNHNLDIQVDTEIFELHVKAAERLEVQHKTADAIEEYKKAETLYRGEFLAEDLYDDWSLELREYYKSLYVKLLGKLSDFYYQQQALQDCIAVNRKITAVEMGDEHAHRRLMDCFARLNQRHLALRQYQLCTEALAKEFDLKPSQETVALYKTIKAQDSCEQDGEERYRSLHLKQA